jgi:precorrin-6B C5,15-methyltransferase / cobalt-precorrin-6B C5,C15-methyltransferase
MNFIHLLGIDGNSLTTEKTNIIKACATLFTTKRFSDLLQPVLLRFPDLRILPISPVSEAISQMEEALAISDISVLASGDPLFFGIGRTLCKRFGEERVWIYPAVSSMQLAFARFKIPWDDAQFFSVHGRRIEALLPQIGSLNKVCLLTDSVNSPGVVASALLKSFGKVNANRWLIHVGENLGEDSEKLTTGNLQEIADCAFSGLSVMIISRECDMNVSVPTRFGLLENEIVHTKGLITKNEVRAATLHALRLPETGVFWDIGAGSGSISIEAARMFPMLQVFAVEKKPEHIDNIIANIQRFNAYNITIVQGDAPDALENLPDPERIFVGGGGDGLQDILPVCIRRLQANGCIVVNAVIEKSRRTAPEILHKNGLSVSLATISVSRSSYLENKSVNLNPITIITGRKPSHVPVEGEI